MMSQLYKVSQEMMTLNLLLFVILFLFVILYFLNSYDTWVASTDVVDEPQDEPLHQGPWEVIY
jgi:hypothetical protein